MEQLKARVRDNLWQEDSSKSVREGKAEPKLLRFSLRVTRMDKIINKYIRGAAQIQWFQDTVVGTGEDAEGETGVNHVLRDVRQNEQSNLSSSSSAIIFLNLYCIQMFQCITLLQGDWIVPFPFIHHILVNCQSEQCGWNW